jgi:hypothetical protein
MGFRDYSPNLNRFLTRDSFAGALSDLNLNTDPWNGNRYAFAGGNPISRVEIDGHYSIDEEGNRAPTQNTPTQPSSTPVSTGITPEHESVRSASNLKVDSPLPPWSPFTFLAWKAGMKIDGKSYLSVYKQEWVRTYSGTIKGAAEAYNIPEYLLAGVAYVEVGGDPAEVDPLAYTARRALPFGGDADKTSLGYVSMQFEVAAKTLGYDPDAISPAARGAVLDSLMDPQQNIAITAKHLSDLRDLSFGNNASVSPQRAADLGAMYNGGSQYWQTPAATSYGSFILNSRTMLEGLLE